jgi:hypothetical protein
VFQPRKSNSVAVPTPLFVIAAGVLAVVALFLLFVLLSSIDWGGSGNIENPTVTFHNETDSPLCYAVSRPDCSDSIKPMGTSHWAVDSCFGAGVVDIYTETEPGMKGRKIYSRGAPCNEWADDAFIVINKRTGEFVVADSLPSDPVKIEGNWTIGDALKFDGFPLFWLGDSYKGREQLTAINMADNVVELVYGKSTCNDTECNAPIWITVEPYCQNSPQQVASLLDEFVRFGAVVTDVEIRGVKGLYVTGWKEPRLYLWVGASAVQMKSNKSDISLQEAAQDLVSITTDPDLFPTREPLPPPMTTSC